MTTSLRRSRDSWLRRLRDERGVALVLVLLVMGGLTITTGSVLYFTTSSARSSSRTSADQQAYALAEAGLNTAVAKIYGASDPRCGIDQATGALVTVCQYPPDPVIPAGTVASPATLVPQCSTGTNASETPSCYETGSTSFSGQIDKSGGNTWFWKLQATGTVPNPGGGSPVVRKLTRSVGITGNNGTNGSSWTRFYQDSTTSCLTIDGVSVPTNFASRGDICLLNGATITGSGTNINAGGRIYIDPPVDEYASDYYGGSLWNSAWSARTQDSSSAYTDLLDNGQYSDDIILSDFGFSFPSSATIQGIEVTIARRASSNTSSTYINDADVYLRRSGSDVGVDKALTTTKWPTSEDTQTYGGSSDLWGTSWTYSNVNSSSFGVRLRVRGLCSSTYDCVRAYVNSIKVRVYYTSAAAIGSAATPISEVHAGNGCQLSTNTPHAPCTDADKVWAQTNDTTVPEGVLEMPEIDWDYWWANAKPGPKHFCTNANPGLSTSFFDNNASYTNGPDRSLTVNGDITRASSSYNCEVVENGVLKGRIKWDHVTHRLDIYGTIFIDGSFRFDEPDGAIIHYFGRATIMSSRYDEIDQVVCAGGTGLTYATSCLTNMSNWNPSQNMLVLMSQLDNEYDQGGDTCTGSPPNCYGGRVPAGFQGILYSLGDCLIHQNFQDSGPVICNTITLPNEGYNPTYWPFPSLGNLTNGMSFSDTETADSFTIAVSSQGDG